MTYLTALALYAAVALPLAVIIGRVIRGGAKLSEGSREQSNGAAHHASAFPSTRIRGK